MTDRDELIRRLQHTERMVGQVTDTETVRKLTQLTVDLKDDLTKGGKVVLGPI